MGREVGLDVTEKIGLLALDGSTGGQESVHVCMCAISIWKVQPRTVSQPAAGDLRHLSVAWMLETESSCTAQRSAALIGCRTSEST